MAEGTTMCDRKESGIRTAWKKPDQIGSYFVTEWKPLLAVTVSGLIYNIGLLAGPWFEGRLAQCLLDVFAGKKFFTDMLLLVCAYVAVIGFVQGARYIKRFYVRRFANDINRNMKQVLYGNLVHKSVGELEKEGAGSLLTKAVSDVDACVEGIRKFTTEIFDTGIALLAYAAMLLWYDWRLALLCLLFPPFSYLMAEKMKTVVERSNAAYKESAGRLNTATLDRAGNAVTYRIYGCEKQRSGMYEKQLDDYEKTAVRAGMQVVAMPPLYQVISMGSTVLILYFGSKNVLNSGWTVWNIAAFTTFLSCYGKLAVKSSKAAKLFNSVQKANVSWKRIRPLLTEPPEETEEKTAGAVSLKLDQAISMGSTVLILYFGSKNVLNSGWTVWNIAAFTTFLSCYGKLAVKSSKAAKLFNSVQKANVSWKRIRPLLTEPPEETEEKTAGAVSLKLDQAGGAYPGGKQIFDGLTISAKPGQIIGITGPVACGKSTLGKIFLGEVPYTGHVLLNGKELSEYSDRERRSMVGWQGHDPELLADSVRNNVALGEEQIDVGRELSRVCLDREVAEMENGVDTLVGSRGVRLSGGQQARTALARTLSHAKPLIVLDDPFAALDRNTEEEIFRELKAMSKDRIILLISHRLYLFDQTDQVIWMENGQTQTGTHEKMLKIVPEYANLCKVWKEGADHA